LISLIVDIDQKMAACLNDKRWFAEYIETKRQRPTQRAPDKWESARFTSLFLTSGLYCSQAESRPAHLRVTQTGWALKSVQYFYY
jgi:hypothetical protein